MKKRLFLDLDGTILDNSRKFYWIYAEFAKLHHCNPFSYETYWNLHRNKLPITTLLGLIELENYREDYIRYKEEKLETKEALLKDQVGSGIIETLQELRKDYSLILLTLRNNPENLIWQLNKHKLLDHFDKVLTGKSGESPQWEKKYSLIFEAFSALNKEDLIVGDRETEIIAGKKLGIRTVFVENGTQTASYIKRFSPDVILSSLNELPMWLKNS